MKNKFIPVNEPVISKEAIRNVNHALKTAWVSSAGEFVDKFENDFAKYLGVKYAISVSSGTAALHVALLSLGIGPGDEVIVPAFTMAATWLAILYVRAVPVFVDCELDTYNIDVNLIEKKISKKTKAIIPVHIYGHSVDMDPVIKIAKKHKLFVIEDAAEAHGVLYKKKKCGSVGDINCFSFYGNKIITTGEGGMVVTNNKKLAERARRFKDLCHTKKRRFIHDDVGFNYRLTNLQAALGCGEIKNINSYIKKKQEMAKLYRDLLKNIPGLKLPITKSYTTNVYWMYAILVDPLEFGIDRNTLREKLKKEGVDTRAFFYPPNAHPILEQWLSQEDKFSNCEYISKRGLYLPSGLAITNDQISRVAEAIINIHQGP